MVFGAGKACSGEFLVVFSYLVSLICKKMAKNKGFKLVGKARPSPLRFLELKDG